jgi:type II secretory ATPase GspE/PulE/Tfp pilus assembly ATPase PilB-like protein
MATMLGRLLVEQGSATEGQVAAALEEQRGTRERIGVILSRGGVDPEGIARALAAQLRLDYAPPPLRPESGAAGLIPQPVALRLGVLPLSVGDRTVRVATADPLDVGMMDDLQFRIGRRVDPVVATEASIARAQAESYGDEAAQRVLRRLSPQDPGDSDGDGVGAGDRPTDALLHESEAPPIVAAVNLLLERAVTLGASDVHIQPGRDGVAVRARVDGVLRPILSLPARSAAAVTSRIKIMAGLDIAVKRRPQDGRSGVSAAGRSVELRVSTLPAAQGEKVVLRLLDRSDRRPSLPALGLGGRLGSELEDALDREHGLFLVTGPTGSGKTTTLYAVLESRDRAGRNIVTLEDPVESRLDGVTQVHVQPRSGLTFAAALRSVLRQDPDIIMVGEMRDRETAEIGLAAALTGHLVLSTLHTIDAPGAVTRLVEMGAPRYLVAGGLVGVLAQRLVRRLCPECRTVVPAGRYDLQHLGLPTPTHLPRAVGCDRCGGTGYRGRVGIFELLRVDAAVRELILDGAPTDAIREAAAAAGMVPLPVDAWAKVEAGVTTLEEVRPFLSLLADASPACRACGTALGRGRLYCPLCGGTVARRCGCGAAAGLHWRFCGSCGDRLSASAGVRDLA